MATTRISDRLVKVEPDKVTPDDIIEFAEALIEEHGHLKGDSGDAQRGWSIHGAIGEAAKRTTGESGKDGTYSRELRDQAGGRVEEHHGQSEFALNDNAADAADVIGLLRAARGA